MGGDFFYKMKWICINKKKKTRSLQAIVGTKTQPEKPNPKNTQKNPT